ncbi:choice-of-anchor K domain-containing protein [uncultured Tessaracoccus sp.]|uniref:choice-of-anchor K domain-containing protein n=1 Tax=uncultured Tessaracoccus sp. TaxID=905023 RepID=UPI0025F8F9B7|nr:choice-of-anchor K domain-containing protein [uncultured Tessaracoccus sp.]
MTHTTRRSGLALAAASLLATSSALVLPAAEASAIDVEGWEARFAEHKVVEGEENCFNFSPVGDGKASDWADTGTPVAAAHGRKAGRPCPDALNHDEQSTLEFVPAALSEMPLGKNVKLGTVTHYNRPVVSRGLDGSLYHGTLELRAKNIDTDFSFGYTFFETPNQCSGSPDCSDDFVGFRNQSASATVTQNGMQYRMVIAGFADCDSDGTKAMNKWQTVEGDVTKSCLWGSFEQVRKLTITKTVEDAPKGWTDAQPVKLTTASSLTGSAWDETEVTLDPAKKDGSAYGSVAHPVLSPNESVTVTEAGLQDGLALRGARCVDGEGTALPAEATTVKGNKVTINVPAATSAAALDVTCTLINAPTGDLQPEPKPSTPAPKPSEPAPKPSTPAPAPSTPTPDKPGLPSTGV